MHVCVCHFFSGPDRGMGQVCESVCMWPVTSLLGSVTSLLTHLWEWSSYVLPLIFFTSQSLISEMCQNRQGKLLRIYVIEVLVSNAGLSFRGTLPVVYYSGQWPKWVLDHFALWMVQKEFEIATMANFLCCCWFRLPMQSCDQSCN